MPYKKALTIHRKEEKPRGQFVRDRNIASSRDNLEAANATLSSSLVLIVAIQPIPQGVMI